MRTTTMIELTATEFDIAWHELGLGRVPFPLDVPSVGATAGERARLAARVRGSLRDRGLWAAEPEPNLAAPLRVLARPDRSVDAFGSLGEPVRALAAEVRGYGVLATLGQGGAVRLTELRQDTLAESIVDILWDCPPGPGAALSVPVSALTDRSPEGADLRALMAERTAGGQFGVTVTDYTGLPRRARTLVTWFDTPRGRYLLVRDGDWLSLAPADNRRIANRLNEIRRA